MFEDILDAFSDDRGFDAIHMRKLAKQKPDRDAKRERESIIKAICNEAMNGKYEYHRNHLHPLNIKYLEERGFTVLCSNNTYFIKWGDD